MYQKQKISIIRVKRNDRKKKKKRMRQARRENQNVRSLEAYYFQGSRIVLS